MKKTFSLKKAASLSLILCLIFTMLAAPVIGAENYEDLKNHWSKGYVLKGIELGWVDGYEDGMFKPDETMSRAEFIKILTSSINYDLESNSSSRFSDIKDAPWAEEYILKAERLGLLDLAYPESSILPNEKITREEAAVLLDHAMMIKDLGNVDDSTKIDAVNAVKEYVKARSSQNNYELNFSDRDEIEKRFVPSVADLSNQDIIKGYEEDNSFKPKNLVTRAEVVTLFANAYGEEPVEVEKAQEPEEQSISEKPSDESAIIEKSDYSDKDFSIKSEDGKFYLVDASTDEVVEGPKFIKTEKSGYLIGEDNSLLKDFYEDGNKTYYVNGEKGLTKGWKQVGEILYYFSPADNRMYRDGIFSTGDGVHWFDKDGRVREGRRRGGTGHANRFWAYPSSKELENNWLKGEDLELRIRGQEIANFAAAHEGIPFKWYGMDLTDGTGVYCVGNTYSAYHEFGIRIPGASEVNIRAHNGYELTRAQYEMAEEFGGERYPVNFEDMWPGDLLFNYSPNFYLGYNHVMIYMGKNGNTPIVIHATLADGLVAEDARKMNRQIGRKYNKEFIRYNTEKNIGIKPYPVAK